MKWFHFRGKHISLFILIFFALTFLPYYDTLLTALKSQWLATLQWLHPADDETLSLDLRECVLLGCTFFSFLVAGDMCILYVKKNTFLAESCHAWDHKSKTKVLSLVCIFILIFLLIFNFALVAWPFALGIISSLFLRLYKQTQGYSLCEINKSLTLQKSIGALWAYGCYTAYYKIVLQSRWFALCHSSCIRERISCYEKKSGNNLCVKKMVLVAPFSCNVSKELIEADGKLEYESDLPVIECDQGGNINRKYKNPVYKISSLTDVYCNLELPSSLSTLWKSKHDMDPEMLAYHRDCFIATLEELIKDDPCILINYDDTVPNPEPLHSVVLAKLNNKENIILSIEN